MRNHVDRSVLEPIADRWSPYGLDAQPVAPADLAAIFEAARWAASSFNEQPWRFLLAVREDAAAFADALSCLVEANRVWARHAGALALAAIRTRFTSNEKPNRTAAHDLGLATAQLMLEASARGLAVHAMGGILPDRAREVYGVPDGFEVFTGLAIGRADPGADVPAELIERERAPRTRRPLSGTVFAGSWDNPAELPD